MKFRAFVLEMAESDIMEMVSTAKYMRIKLTDSAPVFRAYVIGHEGESQGKIAAFGQNLGSVVKKWYKSAIQKLHDKIDIGLKLFHSHVDTNKHLGRMQIGEVVGKALKTINDKLSVVVAAYIEPQFRKLPLDIASIEANIYLTDNDGIIEADVEAVSGIALGSSLTETPGFAGATLLGQIQAFAEKSQKVNFGENKTMTLKEIKDAIHEGKFKPSDLYDSEGIFSDPVIKEQVAERIKNARGFDGRKFEEWDEEKTKLNEKIKEHETTIETLKTTTAKGQVGSLFEKMKEKRELDEREVKFIEKKLSKFEPKDHEKVEYELDKFVDDLVDEFEKLRTDVFGEEAGDGGNGDKVKTKTDGEKKQLITSPRKVDPNAKNEFDTNPLIPD